MHRVSQRKDANDSAVLQRPNVDSSKEPYSPRAASLRWSDVHGLAKLRNYIPEPQKSLKGWMLSRKNVACVVSVWNIRRRKVFASYSAAPYTVSSTPSPPNKTTQVFKSFQGWTWRSTVNPVGRVVWSPWPTQVPNVVCIESGNA